MYASTYPGFITITCLEWKSILESEKNKQIVTDRLAFLSKDQRVTVYVFVMMNNHLHLIWQMRGKHKREAAQIDFLKFTAMQLLKQFRTEAPDFM
jgi:REP element-mobilizing transposase RayT